MATPSRSVPSLPLCRAPSLSPCLSVAPCLLVRARAQSSTLLTRNHRRRSRYEGWWPQRSTALGSGTPMATLHSTSLCSESNRSCFLPLQPSFSFQLFHSPGLVHVEIFSTIRASNAVACIECHRACARAHQSQHSRELTRQHFSFRDNSYGSMPSVEALMSLGADASARNAQGQDVIAMAQE
eukprot:462465-Rhodomonas_salina.1